jgi:L-alanine-DL-glutamate epimerase-like enolase superfamily enzyme
VKIGAPRTAVVGTPRRNLTFVALRTDEGLTSVGEVAPGAPPRFLGNARGSGDPRRFTHADRAASTLAPAPRRWDARRGDSGVVMHMASIGHGAPRDSRARVSRRNGAAL